jgi:AraC-like DNA-binding protein/quercetin dioxygenase-like cupin family protein
MFQKRQDAILDRRGRAAAEITALVYDYPRGHVVPWHFHEWDQVVYASQGVMTVQSKDGVWVVPTHRAVWIPAGMAHTIRMSGAVAMRTLYVRPKLAKELPRACCVINVTRLLRELILDACHCGTLKRKARRERHLIDVILDQLKTVQTVPLQLRSPVDPRAKRFAESLQTEPGNKRPLAELCQRAGASKRTMERLFRDEAGVTVGKWRQQLRLMEAMRLLAEGAKVTHAALDAGYSTPSAFIAMFGKALGTTPRAYFRADSKLEKRRKTHPLKARVGRPRKKKRARI